MCSVTSVCRHSSTGACSLACLRPERAAQANFRVETPSGTVFEDVDLSEDWAEYDEKGAVSVGVYELEGRFGAVKG